MVFSLRLEVFNETQLIHLLFNVLLLVVNCDSSTDSNSDSKSPKLYISIVSQNSQTISNLPASDNYPNVLSMMVLVNDENGIIPAPTRVDWEIIKGDGTLREGSVMTT